MSPESILIRKTRLSKAMSRRHGKVRCVLANKCFQRPILGAGLNNDVGLKGSHVVVPASYIPSKTPGRSPDAEKGTKLLEEGTGEGQEVFAGLRHWKKGMSNTYRINTSRHMCLLWEGILLEGIKTR